ncbi:MAG: BrnT family toxin [Cyanobacteria bacterium P01_F01_bin.143]
MEKHGIDFETAKRIFERPIISRRDERKDYNEIRYVSIGIIDKIVIIVVVHTDREGRTRLISARPASRRERRIYHEQIQKTYDT